MKSKWLIILVVIGLLAGGITFALAQAKPPILKSQVVTLKVKPKPSFTLAVTPTAIESFVGNTVAYSATVTSVKGFAGQVIFSVDGVPAGLTVNFFPGNVVTLGTAAPVGVQINVVIPDNDTLAGDYTLTINAESTEYN
jgi:hypothetical protein